MKHSFFSRLLLILALVCYATNTLYGNEQAASSHNGSQEHTAVVQTAKLTSSATISGETKHTSATNHLFSELAKVEEEERQKESIAAWFKNPFMTALAFSFFCCSALLLLAKHSVFTILHQFYIPAFNRCLLFAVFRI